MYIVKSTLQKKIKSILVYDKHWAISYTFSIKTKEM